MFHYSVQHTIQCGANIANQLAIRRFGVRAGSIDSNVVRVRVHIHHDIDCIAPILDHTPTAYIGQQDIGREGGPYHIDHLADSSHSIVAACGIQSCQGETFQWTCPQSLYGQLSQSGIQFSTFINGRSIDHPIPIAIVHHIGRVCKDCASDRPAGSAHMQTVG